MKFTDTLKELEAKATDGPHVVDHANFELVAIDGDVYEYIANFSAGDFSASDLTDEEIAANAKLYCFLRNHAQEIINLVEAAEQLVNGGHPDEAIHHMIKALAALNKE